jgi:drug/metabolite transporter (DMT)-like permease
MASPAVSYARPIRSPTLTDIALVALLGILWGSAFPAIKVAVTAYQPIHVVMLRVMMGLAVLLAWMMIRRIAFPRSARTWILLAVMAVLNTVMPFFLISWAEQHIDAGITALLMGSGPFFALLITHVTTLDDRMTTPKLIGVALGFSGVLTVIGMEALSGIGRDLVAQLAVFAANLCYVVSGAMIRSIRNTGMEAMAAGNLACAFVMLAPFVVVFGLPPVGPLSGAESGSVLFAVFWLGAVVTGLTYVLRFYLARTIGFSFMSLAAYMVPVAGIAISALLLGETISLDLLIALALVLAGFSIARLGR